jgi:hypothetical protein
MNALIITGISIGSIIVLFLLLTVINILQAGSRKPHGRTMAQILGRDPSAATYDDVEKLSRKEKVQLFIAAETPRIDELGGEYEAKLLSGGVLGKSTELFTNHVFPTGGITLRTKWVGKAFKSTGGNSGTGYNIFEENTADGKKILRVRRIDTSIGSSSVVKDGKHSFLINYSAHNGGTVRSMRDELRKINDTLFIGAGHMALGGGPANPGPFAVVGKPRPWVGIDRA